MHMFKSIGSNFTHRDTDKLLLSERSNENQTDAPSFAFPPLRAALSANAMILNWSLVCFQHPKCLYLRPENADVNCLTNPRRKKIPINCSREDC